MFILCLESGGRDSVLCFFSLAHGLTILSLQNIMLIRMDLAWQQGPQLFLGDMLRFLGMVDYFFHTTLKWVQLKPLLQHTPGRKQPVLNLSHLQNVPVSGPFTLQSDVSAIDNTIYGESNNISCSVPVYCSDPIHQPSFPFNYGFTWTPWSPPWLQLQNSPETRCLSWNLVLELNDREDYSRCVCCVFVS